MSKETNTDGRTLKDGVRAFKAAWRGELQVGCTACAGDGCAACDDQGYVLAGFRWR